MVAKVKYLILFVFILFYSSVLAEESPKYYPHPNVAAFCETDLMATGSSRRTDPQWLLQFGNESGTLGIGNCWWHSLLQRNSFYKVVMRPDLPRIEIPKSLTQFRDGLKDLVDAYTDFPDWGTLTDEDLAKHMEIMEQKGELALAKTRAAAQQPDFYDSWDELDQKKKLEHPGFLQIVRLLAQIGDPKGRIVEIPGYESFSEFTDDVAGPSLGRRVVDQMHLDTGFFRDIFRLPPFGTQLSQLYARSTKKQILKELEIGRPVLVSSRYKKLFAFHAYIIIATEVKENKIYLKAIDSNFPGKIVTPFFYDLERDVFFTSDNEKPSTRIALKIMHSSDRLFTKFQHAQATYCAQF